MICGCQMSMPFNSNVKTIAFWWLFNINKLMLNYIQRLWICDKAMVDWVYPICMVENTSDFLLGICRYIILY